MKMDYERWKEAREMVNISQPSELESWCSAITEWLMCSVCGLCIVALVGLMVKR